MLIKAGSIQIKRKKSSQITSQKIILVMVPKAKILLEVMQGKNGLKEPGINQSNVGLRDKLFCNIYCFLESTKFFKVVPRGTGGRHPSLRETGVELEVPPLGRRMMEMAEADEVKAEAADDGDDDHMYARLLEGLATRCDAE